MLFKILVFSFISIPLNRLQMDNADIEFNNMLNNMLTSITTIGYFLPKLLKHNEKCENDDDCPFIMRCCEIGLNKFCCSPNNYIKLELAYQKQGIETHLKNDDKKTGVHKNEFDPSNL
tara:strand:- start:5648 stop:6001 length:354 start_codon:yes stop_codon:yes gene_type:complete